MFEKNNTLLIKGDKPTWSVEKMFKLTQDLNSSYSFSALSAVAIESFAFKISQNNFQQ